jgi:thiamine biosynthesis lipoprotein
MLLPGLSQAAWYVEQKAIMGTSITAEVWDTNKQHAEDCMQQVMSEMHHIDDVMSPFHEDTPLARVNREASQHPVKIPDELFDLIKLSFKFSRQSHGAFDISFASAGYLYDYRQHKKPSEQQLKQAVIDYRQIQLDETNKTIRFNKPGMRIDLGGIAKGYAVDNSIRILQGCGIRHARVSAGGDSRLLGDRKGRPWVIGIRHPRKEKGSVLALPLSDTAISTSGDYERYFVQDGERYHHILSPRTGKSAKGIWSVTIIGPDATTTDALSTTLFVLGVKKGLQLVDKMKGIDAVMIDDKGVVHYSQGLAPPGE